jgi:predicted permease
LLPFIEELLRPLRQTLRRPAFLLCSSLILGFALAANVAAFAVFHGYLLRPLPYANADVLLTPRERTINTGLIEPQISARLYSALSQIFDLNDSALYLSDGAAVTAGTLHRFERFTYVTPSLFSLLGVRPLLGRALSLASGVPGGPSEVVLSYAFWQQGYGGSPSVIGRDLTLGTQRLRVVGVMPPRFVFPSRGTRFWAPLAISPALAQDGNVNYQGLMRLPSGWTLARVDSALQVIRDRLVRQASPTQRAGLHAGGYVIDALPYRDILLADHGGAAPFVGLFAATSALLLLAILNTVNLALARQRQRLAELHLREVLGATRARLARMLLLEYLPLLVCICAIAAPLAGWVLYLLRANGLPSSDWPIEVALDPVVIAYLLVVAILIIASLALTSLATSFAGNRRAVLAEIGARSSPSRSFRQAQRVLAGGQICMAVVLMICGLLSAGSLIHLLNQPLGFDPRNVSVVTVALPKGVAPLAFWSRVHADLLRLPGTQSAALSNMVPFGEARTAGQFYGTDPHVRTHMWLVAGTPELFETLGVRLLAGRAPVQAEEGGDARSVVISASLAQAYFGRTQVAGESLNGGWLRIIGVAPTLPWLFDPAAGKHGYALYAPLTWPVADEEQMMYLLIRSRATPDVLLPALTGVLRVVQPDAAVAEIHTLEDLVHRAALGRAALTWLVVGFALLAFLIATSGVYAIVAYGTRLRLFEFAVREAVGATRGTILRLLMREVCVLFAVGGAIGMVLAFAAARSVSTELYGVSVLDPSIYLGSAVVIAVAVLAAATVPAWQATNRSPAVTMKE